MDHGNRNFLVCLFALLAVSLRPAPRGEPGASSGREQSPDLVRFAGGGNAAEIPAEFIGNLVFLPVRVNSGKPSLFDLDSRAPRTSIDPARAAALDLVNRDGVSARVFQVVRVLFARLVRFCFGSHF